MDNYSRLIEMVSEEFEKRIIQKDPANLIAKCYRAYALHMVKQSIWYIEQQQAIESLRQLNTRDIGSKTATIKKNEDASSSKRNPSIQYDIFTENFVGSKNRGDSKKPGCLEGHLVFRLNWCLKRLKLRPTERVSLITAFRLFLRFPSRQPEFDLSHDNPNWQSAYKYLTAKKNIEKYSFKSTHNSVYVCSDIFNDFKSFLAPQKTI